MNNLINDITNTSYDLGKWCIGVNNYNAIVEVWNDNYYYNAIDVSPWMKIKQTGTEALHAGLKVTAVVSLLDRTIYHAFEKDLGLREWLPFQVPVPNLSTLFATVPAVAGVFAGVYIVQDSCKSILSDGKKSLVKVIHQDYDGKTHFSLSDAVECIGTAAHAAIAYHCLSQYERMGLPVTTILTGALLYTSNAYKLLDGLPYAKAFVKPLIVVGTLPSLPMGSYVLPFVRTALSVLGTFAKMIGF